ncbi:hypothetical protein D915_003902 [Fasciola hepatica]|uniref:C-type lectin domain-containing protein n=1 Tax=Fasciola hepatica TaxID=6192 RepID=A0A4E0RTY9_FASHE|nr:hypothetical protein D915_003902 [Fasciola hepatica]
MMIVYPYYILILLDACNVVLSEQPLLNVEQSEGSRIEMVDPTGAHRVNFTWTRTNETASWIQAALRCQKLGGSLPRANEMRYFYKTLRSDDAPLHNQKQMNNNLTVFGVNFYLADVLEATMDYPNTESGERMCLVVEKRPNSHLNLAEISAVRSCFTPVNLLVCRFALDATGFRITGGDSADLGGFRGPVPCDSQLSDLSQTGPQPSWIIELKKRAEFQDHHLCFKPTVFYTVCVLCGLIVILILLTSSALAFRMRILMRKLKRVKRRDDFLTGAPSVVGSEMPVGQTGESVNHDGLDVAGSMDILADSAFFRAPGSGPRESYKQAIIQDGYQKLANGPGGSGRAGTRPVRGGGSPWSSGRGIEASARKAQGRGGINMN